MDYGTKVIVTCEDRNQGHAIHMLHSYPTLDVGEFSVQMDDGRVLTNQNLHDTFPLNQWIHWGLYDCTPPTIEFARTLNLDDLAHSIQECPEMFMQVRGGLNDDPNYGNYFVEYRMVNGYSRNFEFTNDIMDAITLAVNGARLGNVYARPEGWVWIT